MTTTDSRLGPGTLTLGTTDYGAQCSNVRLVPSKDSTDGTPTLGTPEPPKDVKTSWTLSGTVVQDWESSTGFVEYCRTNDNTQVSFIWEPNTDVGVTYSGTVTVSAIEIGGDVAAQNTSDFEFDVVGAITRGV